MTARGMLPVLRSLVPAIALAVVSSGCWTGPQALVPILTVPEAPPRVVANFPPEPEPTEDAAPVESRDPADEEGPERLVEERASRPVRPSPPVRAPATAVEKTEPTETDDGQLRRQLISVPEQQLDEQSVGQTLNGAGDLLESVDRASLDSTGRAQYDTASRFLVQARSALAAENFVFAFFLGEKALALADGL
jgi:hypothetical protein